MVINARYIRLERAFKKLVVIQFLVVRFRLLPNSICQHRMAFGIADRKSRSELLLESRQQLFPSRIANERTAAGTDH